MLRRTAPALACLALLAAGCAGSPPSPAREPATAHGEDAPGQGLQVVAAIFPLAWMATEVAPGADVRLLAGGGQDPHDLELTPRDRASILEADIVVYMGDIGYMPQLEEAVRDARGQVVAVAEAVDADRLIPLEEAEEGHEDHHGEEDAHGEVDPHLWFDAGAMAAVAGSLGSALATAQPQAADVFGERASSLRDSLRALDADTDDLLEDCRHEAVIVSHAAYAYLLDRRGFEQVGISGAGGHGDVSPRRLAELTERIRSAGLPAVLAEPFEGRKDAEALAQEAGVELLEVHPLETATDAEFARGYRDLLRAQVETFAAALGCGSGAP